MNETVFIFGAGASYDVVDITGSGLNDRFQPPLTNSLFEQKRHDDIFRYPLLPELLPRIRACIKKGVSLEDFLKNFQKETDQLAGEDKRRRELQLMELKLYLYTLFAAISKTYLKDRIDRAGSKAHIDMSTTNNYVTLLTYLKESSFNGASVVTFNYDLLLDRAMEHVFGYVYNNMQSYYNNPYKLFKIHGSCNWYHPGSYLAKEDSIAEKCIDSVTYNKTILNDVWIDNVTEAEANTVRVPCLAAPLPQTKDFVINEHKLLVTEALKKTQKIVIVGWSASDDYFTDAIKKNVSRKNCELAIVDYGEDQGIEENILKKLSDNQSDPRTDWKDVKIKGCGFSGIWADTNFCNFIFSS